MSICLRCGRALTNKESAKRGYGPGCYKKIKIEHMKDNTEQPKEIEEIEGQVSFKDMDFVEELRRKCS